MNTDMSRQTPRASQRAESPSIAVICMGIARHMAGQFLGVQELYNLVAGATSLVRAGIDLDQRIKR
jgi:hypothetical protein